VQIQFSEHEVAILRMLSVGGIAEEARMVGLLSGRRRLAGVDIPQVAGQLAEMGYTQRVPPQFWMITDKGRNCLRQYLQQEREGIRFLLWVLWEEFRELDLELKQVCSAWQIKGLGEDSVPNMHDDPDYDFAVIERLGEIDSRLRILFSRDRRLEREFQLLLEELRSALDRVEAGEFDFFTGATLSSYHTLWVELHEDLLHTLGLQRED